MAAALNAIPGRFSKANPRTWFATLRHDPITIGILFVAIAIIAVMWIAVEAKITQARATKISDAQRENSNLARAFEEHTIRTLEYVNEIVLSIQKQYEAKGRRFDLQTFYKEARPNLAVVRNAVITDETGQIVLSTESAPRLSLADREHIKVHTGVGNQEMFISKPVLGRVNKQFSIIATRRANKPDGSYAGVVGVAIEPGYFSTFYQEVDLGSKGIVTLVGTDGIVRARLARDSTLLGQDISQAKSFQRLTGTPAVAAVPAETYVSRSVVDNVERIYASRRVRGYPLLVFVGTATNESLTAVTADAHADRVAMSLATVVIGIFAIFLVAFNLRRRQAQAALHASEWQTHALLDGIPDRSWLKDAQGRYQAINRAEEQAHGIPAAQIIGKNALEFRPAHEARGVNEEDRAAMASSVPLRFERRSNLGDSWSEIIKAPIRTEQGEVVGMVGISRDITARKQAEAAHASLEAQLRESQKMQAIGTLAGGIAHDFNNALATILGNAELARQDAASDPSSVLESVEEIRKAGNRARDLVKQILSFSRRQPTERKPIGLGPMVLEAAHLLRATLPARLSLEVHCDDAPPVLADASQIEQVLINLVTNAMQAMHDGPGRISIRLDTVPLDAAITGTHLELQAMRARHPERTLRITVSDTGPGMDAATKERVFEPFFTTKPAGEGTGLGLSVVHGIVHGHEGAITVDSEPGKGTTFTVYLPVADVEVGASTQHVDPGTEADPPALVLDSGLRILYLDDDESLVFMVDRLLKRRGYRVAAYTRQDEALQALRADPTAFDLVLTDYNMPGMSGLDVAREVQAIRPELPVAVTSGFIDEELHAQAAGAGVRDLIFKADSVEVFCDAVQRLAQTVQQKTT